MILPSVSIVIPTFNRAKLLPRAIDSALAQTVPCEVVVCDHGSTDETPRVVARYGNRVEYIRKEYDNGPIACWRDGLENSTGEFVHINFDDDWIDPEFTARTLLQLTSDVAFVYTRVRMHFSGTSVTNTILTHPAGKRRSAEIAHFLLRNRLTISPGCALFRRADVLKNLLPSVPGADGVYGKNSGVGEDLLLFLLATLDYPFYVHHPEPLSHFLAHPTSITVNAKITGRDRMLKDAYTRAKNYYLAQENSIRGFSRLDAITASARWVWYVGPLNYLRAVFSMIFRQIQFRFLANS